MWKFGIVFTVLSGMVAWPSFSRGEDEPFDPAKVGNDKVLSLIQQKMNDGEYDDVIFLLNNSLFGEDEANPTANPYWNDASQANRRVYEELLRTYINALNNLNRSTQIDPFLEKFVTVYAENWRAVSAAARQYVNLPNHGRIVAGEFYRGNEQRNGQFASCAERDRIRALQLMQQCIPLVQKESNKVEAGWFFVNYANFLMEMRNYANRSWKLQALTDLEKLPDYDTENPYGRRYGYGSNPSGAAVEEDGTPVYFTLPESWEAARNDGQRWRWCLEQAVVLTQGMTLPAEKDGEKFDVAQAFRTEIEFIQANFYFEQFGVQTMAFLQSEDDAAAEAEKRQGGIFALNTLADSETICQLATGIKRFELPDEFNALKLFQKIASTPNHRRLKSLQLLADIYQNRRQYPRAAEALTLILELKDAPIPMAYEFFSKCGHYYPDLPSIQEQLSQITGSWARFEGQGQQTSENPQLVVRFRNAKKLNFTAQKVDLDKLYAAMRKQVNDAVKKSPFAPSQRNQYWNNDVLNFESIGWQLVNEKMREYLTGEKTAWSVDVEPTEDHSDLRLETDFPIREPGAYYVEQKAENGNRTATLIWITDTMIVKKQIDGKLWYYIVDSKTGKAIPDAKITAFGFRQEWKDSGRRGRDLKVTFTQKVTEAVADKNGQWLASANEMPQEFTWFFSVKRPGAEKIAAFLGFNWNHVWFNERYDEVYDQEKTFPMTDRPVYRPEQKVQYKFWIARAKYEATWSENADHVKASQYANLKLTVRISDPNGEKALEVVKTTDNFGGLDGEFDIPKDAKLGQYNIEILSENQNNYYGNVVFRVEEYKKPEFEVTVDAPSAPVMLGDAVKATIQAKYYFGAPVTSGTVKYKVTRTPYKKTWYHPARWDWLYGSGYWWTVYDSPWYPGWRLWGCYAPVPRWMEQSYDEPEVVMEAEVPLTPEMDGKLEVTIDTSLALAVHGNQDHSYSISAEVVDESRRVITGSGNVLVARKPFKVHAWTDRGYYRVGNTITADFAAKTLAGKPVLGDGVLRAFRVTYDENGVAVEKEILNEKMSPNPEGRVTYRLKASEAGQYRISYELTSAGDQPKTIEGAQLITVQGEGFDGKDLQFNDLEIIPDKSEYRPGETMKLLVNTNRADATVALFLRATNGVCLEPIFISMNGKSQIVDVPIEIRDQPNFFIEALTVANAQVYTQCREVCVPPEERILTMELTPNKTSYLPAEEASAKIRLTDENGKPFVGSVVVSVYDKSLEYISGGSNIPEIYAFFWDWRRSHNPQTVSNNQFGSGNMVPRNERGMGTLGVFGNVASTTQEKKRGLAKRKNYMADGFGGGMGGMAMKSARMAKSNMVLADAAPTAPMAAAAPMMEMEVAEEAAPAMDFDSSDRKREDKPGSDKSDAGPLVEATVRSNFADTAYWCATLKTDADGYVEVHFPMPENLTTWKISAWALGADTRVGKAETEVVTAKNLILRMQTPRFLTTSDEVFLTANVHNYLSTEKQVQVKIDLPDGAPIVLCENDAVRTVTIPAQGEQRIDWRVRAENEGTCEVTMSALTDEESDAMKLTFPVQIHGILKQEARSGMLAADVPSGTMTFDVPEARRPGDSHMEIRFSPTLAGAMLDALPYLADYPYGCTEQTVSRFLPAVLTQKTLLDQGVNLEQIRDKRANLNAQEMGDAKERAAQWKLTQRRDFEPVFDQATLRDMVDSGVDRLTNMQCTDGGWGWFSGFGEYSTPYLTAYVTRGLYLARQCDMAIPDDTINRGILWLQNYQKEQVTLLQRGEQKPLPDKLNYRTCCDHQDALVFFTLAQVGIDDDNMNEMERFLFRDRVKISYQANAMLGIALFQRDKADKVQTILKYLAQYVHVDEENQTAWLSLPGGCYWWFWYDNEIETQAMYLRLLSLVKNDYPACVPEHENLETAAYLVKHLLNNRKHAVYWNSTRDTAYVLEAMNAYLRTTNELAADMTVEVVLDGTVVKTTKITPENLFVMDNSYILDGELVLGGERKVELRRTGTGPLYYNGYVSFFTLEDFITAAGLEVKVQRQYYRLQRVDATQNVAGSRGQVVAQKVEKYERVPMKSGELVKSGDLIEVELVIDSKNDYSFLMFEDMKPAGFETVDVRSGYNGNALGAYVEYRDNRVVFFVKQLAQGKHSVSYRMRAEAPGSVSALPTRCEAMYAPELRANSDEMKIRCEDK